jgi:hypothetical protein
MRKIEKGLLRKLLLGCVYAAGAALIVASGGSSSGSSGFICKLDVGAIAPATDGSEDIWIGVVSTASGQQFNSVARLGSNGLEKINVALGSGDGNTVRTIAIAEGGSNAIYVGGDFDEGIFRLKQDGTLDTVFDVGAGFDGSVLKIIPAGDVNGDIYVAGNFTRYNGLDVPGLVRLNADGSQDTIFNARLATMVEDLAMAEDDPRITPPQDYVYSGGAGTPNLERWSPSAIPESSPTFRPGFYNPVYSIAPDGNSNLYAGGGFPERLVRLLYTGTDDSNFDITLGSTVPGFDGDVRRILPASDGSDKIYVAGEFTTIQGSPAGGLVRLESSGARDSGFDTGTGFTGSDGTAPFSDLAAIALAPDVSGDIYVGGDFQNYKGTASNGLVRLNSDATLDPLFEVRVSHGDEECSNATLPLSPLGASQQD